MSATSQWAGPQVVPIQDMVKMRGPGMAQQSRMAMEGRRSIHLGSLSLVYRLMSSQIHTHTHPSVRTCVLSFSCADPSHTELGLSPRKI